MLSLLVLFTLIGVTFVLLASQSRRATRADARAEQSGDDPQKQLDAVFAQLVRDTANPHSVLQGHSLLNDMYGNDGVKMSTNLPATTITVNPIGPGQLWRFDFNASGPATITTANYPTIPLQQSTTLPNCPLTLDKIQTTGFFNGCVLTLLDGPGKNLSTRIVGWQFSGSTFSITAMAIDGFNAATLNGTATGMLINGRPFNGTGFGFNPILDPATAPTLLNSFEFLTVPATPTDKTANLNSVYLPNGVFNQSIPPGFTNAGPSPSVTLPFPLGIGGADEDYDAPEAQNLLLGYMPLAPATWTDIIPSLHRPDTVRFVNNLANSFLSSAGAAAKPALQHVARQSMLRPLGPIRIFGTPISFQPDHPQFTGSNPLFDAVLGPWDVDNDGDGIADSVWVDLGFPVQTAPDGRRFKPLAAVLCLDLDGRLNVNAHGNIAQANPNYTAPMMPGTPGNPTIVDQVYAATPPAVVKLPRGSGCGPAEINLGLAPGIFTSPLTDYPNFFRGVTVGSVTYEGRYGEYSATPATYPIYPYPQPGGTTVMRADNVLDSIKRFDFPNNYYGATLSGYGSPSDLWGRAALGIDYAGQPIYAFLQQSPIAPATNGTAGVADPDLPNDPYVINLSQRRIRGAAVAPTLNDNAFTVAELERILRKFDIDSTALPNRLRVLLDPTGANPIDLPRLITTDSYDLPGPSILPTKDIAALLRNQNTPPNTLPTSLHIVDLLRAKVIARSGFPTPLNAANQTVIDNLMATMLNPSAPGGILPAELIAGRRFDLNRPFGNGIDDDGNGVVDEPTYAEFTKNGTGYNESPPSWAIAFGVSAPLDLNNDGTVVPPVAPPGISPVNSDIYARQQYAKHLYILMMLFADQTYAWAQDTPGPITAAQQREFTARRIAQWAVNVVDFRDPDSIMTPFEYDVDPFNGWTVDGVLTAADPDASNPERRIVWGCENPDLVLTETLAFHDRRVKDTATNQLRADVVPDPDLDQVRVPEGSLFLEFYCPTHPNGSRASYPRDLYNASGQLNLGLLAPAGAGGQFPVWRVAISESTRDAATGAANDVNTRVFVDHPDKSNFDPIPTTGSNDPIHGSLFDPASTPGRLRIERLIWFAGQNPSTNPDVNQIYYNVANTSTLLNPGQYAVVGSRPTTYVGLTTGGALPAQRITLDTAAKTVTYVPANATIPNAATTTYPALPIICAAQPASWSTPVGVSISEPLFSSPTYYSQPTLPGPSGVNDTYAAPLNNPLDSDISRPLAKDLVLSTGLKLNYKTALLQRLANPLVAFDPDLNPYITVDWQPIDLTVFNGEKRNDPSPSPFDPSDPGYPSPPPALMLTGGRERGTPTPSDANLWNSVPQQPTTTQAGQGVSAVFDYNLNQSLGYLNKALGIPWTSPPAAQAAYAGAPNPTTGGNTFPWITWNNRPFTSNMELLQVPATSAEQLLRQFSSLPATLANPYDATQPPPGTNFHFPCKHLLNFFLSQGANPSDSGNPAIAPYFYRLLEYVHVPSPFVGTETFLNPSTPGFMAPFNKVSNYRDPGRVNINTIPGPSATAAPTLNPGSVNPIWSAILNGGPGPNWAQIVASRRGDNMLLNNVTTLPTMGQPTVFAHPFRTAGGAAFSLPNIVGGAQAEVNATLMRPEPAPPPSTRPLFQMPIAAAQSFTNPDRNSYFRYQPLERLSNLLTTRSNVYAVWITVGYFEALPNPTGVDAAHPDGFQLGQEIGSDSGEVKRHRAFYIYDRSIPVGFEPGKDHNIDQGVLLRRFVE